jgi:hypothetical protein
MRAVAAGCAPAAAGVCWALAGAGLVASAFLPWVSKGVLATSSPLDAVRLIRTGVLDAAVPAGAVVVLLSLPAVGIGLLGLSCFDGRALRIARAVLFVIGALLVGGWLSVLAGSGLTQLASGAWLAIASLSCALCALLFTLWVPRWSRLQEDVR